MKRWHLYALLALSAPALVMLGCGGGGNGDAQGDWVVGVWEAHETSDQLAGPRDNLDRGQLTVMVDFRADGGIDAMTIVEGRRTDHTGTWQRVGDGYRVTLTGDDAGETELFHRQGEELYVQRDMGGGTAYLWLHRL